MSTSQNNIVRSVNPNSMFESVLPVLSSAVSYNQGDMLYWNSSSKIVATLGNGTTSGSGNAANLLGVARQKVVSGVVANPYTGISDATNTAASDAAGPVYGVVAFMTLKTGDAFNIGDKVYPTTDPQTVTSSDPGNALYVGIFQGQQAVASATAGQTGDILIGCRALLGATNQIDFG